MSRYFDAEKVTGTLASMRHKCDTNDIDDFYNMLSCAFDVLPTADVRENVHAHWEEADKYGNRRCSNCKSVEHVPTLMGKPIVWDFCPNCGAQMSERRVGTDV